MFSEKINTKRFLLFFGSFYYPRGGMEDLIKSFDTLDECKSHIEQIKLQYKNQGEGLIDWFNIFDKESSIVYK